MNNLKKRTESFTVGSFLLMVLLLCSLLVNAGPIEMSVQQEKAAYALIMRIIPSHAPWFKVEFISAEGDKDVFEIESKADKIILRGNNGVAIASALNYYLKNYTNCHLSWNGSNLKLPAKLPMVPQKIRKKTPYDYRYYLNYCTFNYTMSWWDWERWQWEIDWMAMNGINMPLALTGQNSVWDSVYKSLGFDDRDLANFYSGPAYFNWFWMGNFDGWMGPTPKSFMDAHEVLQKKILARERELGMKPILPAFTGHVPPAFKDKFPQSKVAKTNSGGGFADAYILDPNDPMFIAVGKKFTEELIRTYGTDHIYSADTFNENHPPSNDSLYLNDITKKVYASMAEVDPKAIWVMQGWMFHISANFWQPTQTKAVLNAVPEGKMLVLDLYAETNPIWKKNQAFYGKNWIWCMLHNFGGNISMFGRMNAAANDPANALNDPGSGQMKGIGLTPEGIEQNPVMYELMLENVWRNQPIELDSWLKGYARRRYGQYNKHAEEAWEVLKKTVYDGAKTEGGAESIITGRPTFNTSTPWAKTELSYKPQDLVPAWDKLMLASKVLKNSDGFRYDLVDVGRQVLANYANALQQQLAVDYKNKNAAQFRTNSKAFIKLIDDLDELLATRKDFSLGKWLNDAKRYGKTEEEKRLYERNARDLITLWGDKNSPLNDYGCKQWSGLLKGFYKPRWEQFFSYVMQCMAENRELDLDQFSNQIKDWEWQWVHGTEVYSEQPEGDAVELSAKLYRYYKPVLTQIYK